LAALLRRGGLEVALSGLIGSRVDERLVLGRHRVPQIAEHPHHFVVTEQHVDRAAGARCFLFQLPQQVECLERIRSAIEHVANLHQVGGSTRPTEAPVKHACRLKDLDQPIVRAMDIADGDDPIGAIDLAGGCGDSQARRAGRHENAEEERPGRRQTDVTARHE